MQEAPAGSEQAEEEDLSDDDDEEESEAFQFKTSELKAEEAAEGA